MRAGRPKALLSAVVFVAVIVSVFDGADAKVKTSHSPKGQRCCHFPDHLGGLGDPTQHWLDTEACPRLCPTYNATSAKLTGDGSRVYVYKGSEKSGTSITLLLLHDLLQKVGPLTGYTVKRKGGTWQNSLGFQATFYPNKTVLVEAGSKGLLYKHGTTKIQNTHTILSLRDPRDIAVSWWHHKHRVEPKEPVPKNWFSRGRIPKYPYNPHLLYHGAMRFPIAYLVRRKLYAGFLPLTFKATTQDMENTLYQLAEFFQMDVYASDVKDDVAKVFHDMRNLYDRSHAWALIKKYEETGEVAPRSDWFGVTHFNSGRVGDYLKELTDADIAGMDGVMCSKFPLVASMWGASNCTLTDEKMATFFTKF